MNNFMIKIKRLLSERMQSFFRYTLVGSINTLLYTSLNLLFFYIFHLGLYIAITLAFMMAASFQFLVNRKYSFQADGYNYTGQIVKYCCVLAITYITSVIVTTIFFRLMSSVIICTFVTSIINLIIGFLLSRYWVFSIKSRVLTDITDSAKL